MKRMYDLVGDLPRMEGEFLSNEFQIVVVLHAGLVTTPHSWPKLGYQGKGRCMKKQREVVVAAH